MTTEIPDVDESTLGQLPQTHLMGNLLFDPCWAERFHLNGYAELLHVRSGTVRLETRNATFTAGPEDVLLLPANTEHRDVFDLEQGLGVFMVQFAWPGAPALFSRLAHNALPTLSSRQRQEVSAMLTALERDLAGGTPTDHLLARTRLHTLLLFLLREAGHPDPSAGAQKGGQRSREIMLAARDYLNRHYQEPISLEGIAEAIHVSPFHLSHVFSQENDFSLFAYLTNLRMDHAQALLHEGRMKVTEVAQAVGFENSSYFSKVFRKHFGYPPSKCPSGRT